LIVFEEKVLRGISVKERERLAGGWCKATLSSFLMCIFYRYYYCDQIKEAVMTRACSTRERYSMHVIVILISGMEDKTWEIRV
jgi:hypothetical protein